MIASVARESGRTVREVGADSYALTLWTHLHSQDAERMESLIREAERLDLAEVIVRGWIGGTKEIDKFRNELRLKLTPQVGQRTLEELSADADALWQQHERAKRPVS